MVKTRSMTRKQNHDDASSKKRIKTCDPDWSDLNHDVLLVLMQLGVVDFLAFTRVCKSWRSLALSNKNKFIVSRPPMSIKSMDGLFNLTEFEKRELKTIPFHLAGRKVYGVTCGYLILYGKITNDCWLVNPVTRHELHFPKFIAQDCHDGILVFSPSVSGWVFVVSSRYNYGKIWFSIAGKPKWDYFSVRAPIHDVVAFNGKIYTLYCGNRLGEVRLYPTPKLTLLEIKNFPKPNFYSPLLVSSGKILYVLDRSCEHPHRIHEINFRKMEWESREKIGEEYKFFVNSVNRGAAVIRAESWADYLLQCPRAVLHDDSGLGDYFRAPMWYFFHDCLNVNLLNE